MRSRLHGMSDHLLQSPYLGPSAGWSRPKAPKFDSPASDTTAWQASGSRDRRSAFWSTRGELEPFVPALPAIDREVIQIRSTGPAGSETIQLKLGLHDSNLPTQRKR